ncbi:GNAT family N-acetyltransferase [Rhodobacteraceae bacterium F11138]|nr:GNAT family N-acetyltransferase [Rhodobacteraceae bacterium F11138]
MAATHAAAFHPARPWSADEFTALLENRFCHIIGDARCFALIRVIADEAELLTIATHPRHQGQGLAQRCMTQWQQMAASLGATRAFLEVASDNPAARALYAACGYDICGRRAGYYPRAGAAPADAILMARPLP